MSDHTSPIATQHQEGIVSMDFGIAIATIVVAISACVQAWAAWKRISYLAVTIFLFN